MSSEKLPMPITIREAINSFMEGETCPPQQLPQELPKCTEKFSEG